MKNVLLVAGHAGAGKTTFSRYAAARAGWPLLDKDTLSRCFVEALAAGLTGDPHDRHSDAYLESIRPLEYRALLETMWDVLDSGADGVVITAPFIKELLEPGWVERTAAEYGTKGVRLTVVWMHCDREDLHNRIVARGAARDRWKLDNWSRWSQRLDEPTLRPHDLRVDNSDLPHVAIGPLVDELLARLQQQ